jgi:hypothetical protein
MGGSFQLSVTEIITKRPLNVNIGEHYLKSVPPMGILNPSVSEGETLPLRVLERAKDSTEVWHSQQVELARLSSAGKLITAEGSGHLIHLERPDLVAQAIREAILRDLRPGPHPATSEGQSIEEARASLVEALSLFFETADPSEVVRRFHDEIFITQIEVPVG